MDNSRRTTSYSADAGRSGSARVVASSATPLGQAGIAENVGRSIDKVDSCGWHFSFAQSSTGSNLFSLPTGRDLKEESLKKKAASVDHRRRQTTEQLEYLACMGKAHGSGCPQNRPPSFATGCQQAGCGRVTPAPKREEQRSQGQERYPAHGLGPGFPRPLARAVAA